MRAVDLATRATCTRHHHHLLMPDHRSLCVPMEYRRRREPVAGSHDSGSDSRAVRAQDSAGKAQPNGFGQTTQLVKHLG